MSWDLTVKKPDNKLGGISNDVREPLTQKQIQIDPKLIREVDDLEVDIQKRKKEIDAMHDIFQNLNELAKDIDMMGYKPINTVE